jgi:hypothetical protein
MYVGLVGRRTTVKHNSDTDFVVTPKSRLSVGSVFGLVGLWAAELKFKQQRSIILHCTPKQDAVRIMCNGMDGNMESGDLELVWSCSDTACADRSSG